VVSARPRLLYPREADHYIRGWVGPRASLNGAQNLAPTAILLSYSVLLCIYFIRTCVFFLVVLHFAFCPYCTTHTSMPPVGFEPAIPAGELPQHYALDRTASGVGWFRSPDRPARSKSLYQLHCPGPLSADTNNTKFSKFTTKPEINLKTALK
jgi:hypothetical protein